ncbi:HNH endonuclease domain-containing protein [Paenibacillus sp. HW567]|uniref:HNH endonuclease domain-containing protein n=1 Tax=Paenibacillus sp. HW567 TaxID=1034769 RepID=UPI001E65A89A|nr:HNH endonuclease domain-containing protein [Paenibacillus sp. HW567]
MNLPWNEQQIRNEFMSQHRLFLEYVERNYRAFAIGKLKDLENLDAVIQRDFPLVYQMIRLKERSYSEHLNKLFGYQRFKVKDFFYYIKKKALDNIGMDRYSSRAQIEIVNILKANYPKLSKEIGLCLGQGTLNAAECGQQFQKLKQLNISMDNFRQMDIFQKEWNDYHFVMESGIRVCPYCNRQYITPILSDNGKMRADIDHFLPKCDYPYFSMSLYNLVPVCKSCNQALKGDRKFTFANISPYEEHIGEHFRFEADVLTFEVSTVTNSLGAAEQHLDIFKIESLYNYHRNQVEELVKKRKAYPDDYIHDLYEKNKAYFNSELEIKQIIVGYIDDESRLNDEAFLKFRRDLAEQLGFLSGNSRSRIGKLKNIVAGPRQTRPIP